MLCGSEAGTGNVRMNQELGAHHPTYHYGEGAAAAAAAATTGGIFPVSAFSAFHLLRNYNYLLTSPHAPEIPKRPLHTPPRISPDAALQSPKTDAMAPLSVDIGKPFGGLPQHPFIAQNLLGYHPPLPLANSRSAQLISPDAFLSSSLKRQRGEKKPIPDEQKDEKYFERRRRNNQAAKKSRDARKIREDQIALRATILEHENAILKAQLITLREEATSLRQMLLQKKSLELSS